MGQRLNVAIERATDITEAALGALQDRMPVRVGYAAEGAHDLAMAGVRDMAVAVKAVVEEGRKATHVLKALGTGA